MNKIRITDNTFDQLFKEFYPQLTAFAFKYLNNIDDSKEIVQELFIHLYEKKADIRIQKNIKAYLFQSVRNRCLNIIKFKIKNNTEASPNLTDPSYNSDYMIETVEFEQLVFSLIDKLQPACKNIFKLSRFEQKSNDEIAMELKISKRTVEIQISKALKFLRQEIHNLNNSSLNKKTLYLFLL